MRSKRVRKVKKSGETMNSKIKSDDRLPVRAGKSRSADLPGHLEKIAIAVIISLLSTEANENAKGSGTIKWQNG
jgi:hypothetical protein